MCVQVQQATRKGIIQFKLSSVTKSLTRPQSVAMALSSFRRILAADSKLRLLAVHCYSTNSDVSKFVVGISKFSLVYNVTFTILRRVKKKFLTMIIVLVPFFWTFCITTQTYHLNSCAPAYLTINTF